MAISKPPRAGKAKNNRTHSSTPKKQSSITKHIAEVRHECEKTMSNAAVLSLRLMDQNLVMNGNVKEISTLAIVFSKDVMNHRERLVALHEQCNRPFRDNSESDAFKASSLVQQYLEWMESYDAVIEPSIIRLGMLLTEASENLNNKQSNVANNSEGI